MKFLWTTVYVENLEESVAFYSSLPELQVLKRFPAGPGVEIAFLGNSADNETLVELIADGNRRPVQFGESISLGFAVKSMNGMLDMVKSKGIPVHAGPFETPGFKFFCIKDPNGLNIQFFEQKSPK
jgi:lactoylglutathione lyase